MTNIERTRQQITAILTCYELDPAAPQGNEHRAWEGILDGNPLRLADFGDWCALAVAFGSVRNAHGTPMGELGLASAALYLGDTSGATGLPNHQLPSPKWRVAVIAPMGRTLCQGPEGWHDGFGAPKDIVAYLLSCRPCCAMQATHPDDLFRGAWEKAEPGWTSTKP